MGTFTQRIGVAASRNGPFLELDAVVDTGATYTFVPASLLRRLGVEPDEQREFEIANGTVVRRGVADLAVRLGEGVRYTLVVFGDENARTLLGAVTLETFGLAVDPVHQRLVSVRGLLL